MLRRSARAARKFANLTGFGGDVTVQGARGKPTSMDVSLRTVGAAHHPAEGLGRMIEDALDPVKAPGKVKRFTPEEIAKLNDERGRK